MLFLMRGASNEVSLCCICCHVELHLHDMSRNYRNSRKIIVEVEVSREPHVLKLVVGSKQQHAPCEILCSNKSFLPQLKFTLLLGLPQR